MQPPSIFSSLSTLFCPSVPLLYVSLSLPCRCSQAFSLSLPQLLCPCLFSFLSASSSLPAHLLWLLLFFLVLLAVLQVYSSFLFASSCSHLPALLLLYPFLFFFFIHSSSSISSCVACRCTQGPPQRQPSSARSPQDPRHTTSMALEWEGRSVSPCAFVTCLLDGGLPCDFSIAACTAP